MQLIPFLSISDLDLARKVQLSLASMFGSRVTFSIRSFPPKSVQVVGIINDLDNPDLENLVFFNAGWFYCAHLNNLL